jgi:lysine-N-methylase
VQLHIPAFLNYDCVACGGCCRDYEITLSDEKYELLRRVDWRAFSPDLEIDRLFELSTGVDAAGPYCFALRPDGTCAFLMSDNRCLIHKVLGFEAKSLACKFFPITFAETPTGIYVGCRFNCNAVAQGMGRPLARSEADLRKLAEEFHAAGAVRKFPERVAFDRRQELDWADYLHLEQAMINMILRPDASLPVRVAAIWRLTDLLRQAKLDKVRGPRFAELVDIVSQGMVNEIEEDPSIVNSTPSLVYRRLFGQFLFFLYRRRGTRFHSLPWRGRLQRRMEGLRTSLRFSFMRGSVPFFPDEPPVNLSDVWKVPLSEDDQPVAQVVERYLAAKLFGKQIFGPLFFDYSLVEGLTALVCAYAALLWYARASTLSRGGRKVETKDVVRAVEHVDFSFGYSPAPRLWTERLRIRLLGHGDTPGRLATWLSRPIASV